MATTGNHIHCDDSTPRRRQARARKLNGIDYVDVTLNDDGTAVIAFYVFKPAQLNERHIRIEGGQRILGEDIEVIALDPDENGYCFRLVVSPAGDFSQYTLRLVDDDGSSPLEGFDPRAAHMSFSFMIDCPSQIDCVAEPDCPPEKLPTPEISYLAKDYASFRQLALDRLALLIPDWIERHVPDIGITLVELLAYVGDYLSYYQDSVATEAYLHTARQRISVRRHARLVDYRMHEGLNARTWLRLQVEVAHMTLALERVYFITDQNMVFPVGVVAEQAELEHAVPRTHYDIFEPVDRGEVMLYRAHNTIRFYTWGERECCLPRGATRATLRDGDGTGPVEKPVDKPDDPSQTPPDVDQVGEDAVDYSQPPSQQAVDQSHHSLHLNPGDVLIFIEVIDPKSGNRADANPRHRHAVRLTKVTPAYDPVYGQPVVDIEWDPQDALPFPLCISAETEDCEYIEDVSIAAGNVILIDHGQTVPPECLDVVEAEPVPIPCDDVDCYELPIGKPRRYRPHLDLRPLVFADPVEPSTSAWATLYRRDARDGLPQLHLRQYTGLTCSKPPRGRGKSWTPRYDLLASDGDARHYVVEIDNDGIAHLRFSDGDLGKQPEPDTVFWATYRVGGGPAGNVGIDTIHHMIVRDGIIGGIMSLTNPLSAVGGQPPEPISEVKLYAPYAFRQTLLRAITPEDYAILAGQYPNVQKAAAQLVHTTGRDDIIVTVDPVAGQAGDAAFLERVRCYLLPYRRIGHRLRVQPAQYIPLDVTIEVCVLPTYERSHVGEALLEQLGSGSGGFFHPDRLTFGTPIAFSQLVAAAQHITGVESVKSVTIVAHDLIYTWPSVVDVDPYEPGEQPSLTMPIIAFGPSEIPLLANDPNFPEYGTLTLILKGGR